MAVNFVILCMGRTGSHHLTALIDSHPRARCFGEVFNTKFPKATDEHSFAFAEHADPLAHAVDVFGRSDADAVGFKLPHESILQHPEAEALLDPARGISIIRLSRDNLLEILVSRRMVQATWVSQSTSGSYGDATIRIEPRECLRALEAIEHQQARINRIGHCCRSYAITYEDVVGGHGVGELQRFLGLEPIGLSSPIERLRVRTLAETIDNWEEVEAALSASRFADFLPIGSGRDKTPAAHDARGTRSPSR